ncbi:uncharacterized protein [Dysidea avara]|uniref:uncharacterized protein isoform X2 n=1 Tax=Dysidea avara TaxID=196820 RepID=UPI00332DE902
MRVSCIVIFLLAICGEFYALNDVQVQDAGIEYVKQFTTSIVFYLRVANKGQTLANVTISPKKCCLIIDQDDCEIMKLSIPTKQSLAPYDVEESRFYFRNFYPRFRRGNCSFKINIVGKHPHHFSHTITFNTFPDPLKNETVMKCDGIDQDADRNCTPVDCAIKYKGKRNFYRNSTGKCEKVVPCNTRGIGNKVIAYYDWEENRCHPLDWKEDDNAFKHVQSDTKIPENINIETATGAKEFHDFEPQKLEQDRQIPLDCNHGRQVGIYCVCDEGWQSTGLHVQGDGFVYSWCNAPSEIPDNIPNAPVVLNKAEEAVYSTLIVCATFLAILLWVFIMYQIVFWRTGRFSLRRRISLRKLMLLYRRLMSIKKTPYTPLY